jgi:hypothetical protein
VHARREHLDDLAADGAQVVLIGDSGFAAEHLASGAASNVWVLDGGISSVPEDLVTDDPQYVGEIVDRTGPPEFGPERDAWYTEYFDWELALLRESEGDAFFEFGAVTAT